MGLIEMASGNSVWCGMDYYERKMVCSWKKSGEKVYSKEDYDKNEWTVEGEPNTTIVVARPATVELTCATIVNRIPDVINGKPGYVSTDKLDELKYLVKPMNEYVK